MASANRDESIFSDPDRFDPRRANAKLHTTFATGPHVCLGMHLARLEARAAITGLAEHLPHLHADPTRPSAPQGLVFRKPPTVWAGTFAEGWGPRWLEKGARPLCKARHCCMQSMVASAMA
jgi:cytochrome P450